jgi:hypothetical protein
MPEDRPHTESTKMSDYRFEEQLAISATNISVRAIAKAHVEGRLRLRPPFQRNLVWDKDQKSYLIDTILRNLPIPELYIQNSDVPGKNEDLIVVVDGQQRISTCIAFLQGELRLTGRELAPEWEGRKYDELHPDLQARFSRYKLIVRELPNQEENVIREIFRRLNRVVEPLLPQELRHAAYSGAFIELIEIVAAHPLLQELRVFSAKDFRRRGNDELISEIVFAHIQKAFPNKKEGLDEAFRTYATVDFPMETAVDIRRRFGRVYAQLAAITSDVRISRFRNKSDFYSLMVYLLARAESLPLPIEGTKQFAAQLELMTTKMAEFRRVASTGVEIEATAPDDILVMKYMRAVERAASDRLSRVRRNDVLEEWFGPALGHGEPKVLDASDEVWLGHVESAEQESEAEVEIERKRLNEVLLRDTAS